MSSRLLRFLVDFACIRETIKVTLGDYVALASATHSVRSADLVSRKADRAWKHKDSIQSNEPVIIATQE